ncbi:MAG TPA: N-acetylmuramoyl-L-alanine amidase [Anaerolineae bacterium]|nr:N-acetylmuramoyl-L-alanine amidase [Anaerolineae bacterium]
MKKLVQMAVPFVLLMVLVSAVFAQDAPVAGHRIILDPGHGGSDPGTTECPGLYEKDANLDIAYSLKALLEANGAVVGMTRTDSTSNPSNTQRANFANSNNGEVLLSIHLNGSKDHSVDGTIGLWGKRNKDLQFARVMHGVLPGALQVPDQGVTNFASGVLLKSDMPATIQESVYLSNSTECTLLKDGTGDRQGQISQALYNGLANWFATR